MERFLIKTTPSAQNASPPVFSSVKKPKSNSTLRMSLSAKHSPLGMGASYQKNRPAQLSLRDEQLIKIFGSRFDEPLNIATATTTIALSPMRAALTTTSPFHRNDNTADENTPPTTQGYLHSLIFIHLLLLNY